MMDRGQIEADIFALGLIRQTLGGGVRPESDSRCVALDRAIARLRADLARVDGPADGFVRIFANVYRSNDGGFVSLFANSTREDADRIAGPDRIAVVVADIPILRIFEVEGTVVE